MVGHQAPLWRQSVCALTLCIMRQLQMGETVDVYDEDVWWCGIVAFSGPSIVHVWRGMGGGCSKHGSVCALCVLICYLPNVMCFIFIDEYGCRKRSGCNSRGEP